MLLKLQIQPLPSVVGKAIGGVATLSGYWYGYKIKKSYDKEIEVLENLKALTDKEGMFLATADIEDISDVSTWTNIAIIDRNNIDISTGHVIEGSHAKKNNQSIYFASYCQNTI